MAFTTRNLHVADKKQERSLIKAMNGIFLTRNLQVAAYLVALVAPYPTTKAEEGDRPGMASFEFQDPTGEWLRQSKELDLSDAESDKCHIPCARLFAAQKFLCDDMHNVIGRQYPKGRR